MLSTPKFPLGALVRKLRQDAGLSQHELAEKANLSQGAITMLERGRSPCPALDTTCQLAAALGVPVNNLVDAFLEGWHALQQARRARP